MIHDCVPNTQHVIDGNFKMTVRASVSIPKGAPISTFYTQTLEGTLVRRRNLMESKFFQCQCKRCSDPTELGTNFSSIKCIGCADGYHLPSNSLDSNSKWPCLGCGKGISIEDVDQILVSVKQEMDGISESELQIGLIPTLEEFIRKHSGNTLHPNHYLLIGPIYSLAELYGRCPGWYMEDLKLGSLERKEQLCHQFIRILEFLHPGMTRMRGKLVYFGIFRMNQ